jgi:GPH family glycoside/pentoside/hexuronide:cation symporter
VDRNLFLRDVRYGAAGLALGMPTIPLLVHLPAAYAEGLGLGLTATGAALFAARALDVITDPIIGIASDRLKSPWGRRKPLILVGAIIAAVGALYLLGPQQGVGPWYLAIWAAVMYLGWTLIMIPYQAWGADLSNDYAGRTRVTSVREGFMLGGILLAGAIPAAAVALGYDERVAG